MKLVYRLLKSLYLWVIPLVIVVLSVILVSTNAQIYKDILNKDNFYQKTSSALKSIVAPQYTTNENIPQSIVFFSVIKNTVTDSWLQNLFEKNIDASVGWLRGNEADWAIFLPVSDVNKAINAQIDEVGKVLLNNENLAICTPEQAKQLSQNGYQNIANNACIPQEVKSGQQTFSQFFNLKSEENPLNTLLPNTPFNNRNDRFIVGQITDPNGKNGFVQNALQLFRSLIISVQNTTIPLLIAIVILGILLIIMAKMVGYKRLQQMQSISLTLAISTLLLCFSIFITTAISLFVAGSGGNAFLPGIGQTELVNLLIWKGIEIVFACLVPALYASAILLLIWVAARVAKYLAVRSQQSKNEEILTHKSQPELSSTFDGQFRQQIAESKTEMAKQSLIENNQFEEFYNPETLSTKKLTDEVFFTGTPDQIEDFYDQEEDFLKQETAKTTPNNGNVGSDSSKSIPGF